MAGMIRTLLLFLLITGFATGRTLKVFVLTGESNALGTLAETDESMRGESPGGHAADAGIPLFWDNRADGTAAGDDALGDSGGGWVTLGPQDGGHYSGNDDHWGPEVGFARLLWDAGYRDFAVVKAARGGGGNGLWAKDSADDHMYGHVVDTVDSAVAALPEGYADHEVAGLLYVQGESNDAAEADAADTRFSELLANLREDLAGAAVMKAVLGGIGGGSTPNRDLTRTRQEALAASDPDVGYASAAGATLYDGLHYDADSILLLGGRMAAAMTGTGALGEEPLPAPDALHAWFVADHGVVESDGGAVARWADLAGGSAVRDLTRSVSGRPVRPRVTAAEGRVRRVMRFDGATDLWASSGEFGEIEGPRSVAVLCRVWGDGYLFDGSTSSGRTRAQVREGEWQAGAGSDWDAAEPATAASAPGVWRRHVFTFDEAGGATEVTHWIDGAEAGTASDVNSGALGGLIVGSNGGSPFRHLRADVAELAVFSKVLDSSEVAALDGAWEERWGEPAGPPFGVSVAQEAGEVARFGLHGALRVTVDAPAAGTTLESVDLRLKGGTPGNAASVRVLRSAVDFRASDEVLAEAAEPTSGTLSLPLAEPLEEGANHFWVALEPRRRAELGGTLDVAVEALDFSGNEAGRVSPDDGDPPGELTLALVPLVSDVRRSGDFGVSSYRIPGIVCDGDGVLHAVFDHRWNSSADLPADMDVGYARSEDGGATWSGFRAIMDFDGSVPGSAGNGVGDPCVLYDPATDTIWVAALWSFGDNAYWGSGPGTAPEDTGQYVLVKSEDGGETWSDIINVTSEVKDDPDWRLIFQGPGHGLAMRDGTLVFPSQYRDANGTVRSCSVYSDDHGETWDFGSGVPTASPQTNENTVCELDDGRLLFSMRTPSGSNGQRAWIHYEPGGAEPMRDGEWSPLFRLPSVPDPVCQGSVIQWTSTHRGAPRERVLFANPGSSSGRVDLTLRVSGDGGESWPVSRLLYDGPSAYSSVCILPDRSVGVLFEKDNYSRMTFMRVEEDWLWRPGEDADGDGMPDAWERFHGTRPDEPDAGRDDDGDGRSNGEEYEAGTDPQSAASAFRVRGIERAGGSAELRWSSVPGRGYVVEWSEDLATWEAAGRVTASAPETETTLPASGARGFLRVRVE